MKTVNGVSQKLSYYMASNGNSTLQDTSAKAKAAAGAIDSDIVEISSEAVNAFKTDLAIKSAVKISQIHGLNDEEYSLYRNIMARYKSSGMTARDFFNLLTGKERTLVKRVNSYGCNFID